jgi:hypothetical protein
MVPGSMWEDLMQLFLSMQKQKMLLIQKNKTNYKHILSQAQRHTKW